MYISTWIIVIIVIAGIYLYSRSKKRGEKGITADGESLTAEEMWERGEANTARVLEKSPLIENYLQDERDMVKAMERDMIRLRERFKHDTKKQLEVARDWMDYSGAVAQIKFAREMLDVDMEDTAHDSYDGRTKESYITVQEIGKRVEEILGNDSSSKLVHDRLRKQAEAIDEIGGKMQKGKEEQKDKREEGKEGKK